MIIPQKPWYVQPYSGNQKGCLLKDANGTIIGAFPDCNVAEHILERERKVVELETEILQLRSANEVLTDTIGQQEEKLKAYRQVQSTQQLV